MSDQGAAIEVRGVTRTYATRDGPLRAVERFLADRVVVMTPRPGRVAEIVAITLPRPRRPEVRFTPEFNDLVQRVGRLLGI